MQKLIRNFLVFSILSVFLAAGSAMALPLNTRPVTPLDSGEQTLQDILDSPFSFRNSGHISAV